MRTKYYIEIDGEKSEIPQRCIKNWADIQCSYKRVDFGGVTRSFSSQFEFVNEIYDKLIALYLKDGFKAEAILSLCTMTDRWEWEEQFAAPIDFSSITWDSHTLKVNCIDNGLASLIKAKKSTKFEFAIGGDILPDSLFHYDRVPMIESITYEFTQGEQYDNCADILVHIDRGELPFIGNVASETTINHVIEWNDDQTNDADSYIFRALTDIKVTLDFEVACRVDYGAMSTDIGIGVRRNGVKVSPITDPNDMYNHNPSSLAVVGPRTLYFVGSFNNPGSLTSANPKPAEGQWATIDGKVWATVYDGMAWHWHGTNETPEQHFTEKHSGRRVIDLKEGDVCFISSSSDWAEFRIATSKFTFNWIARGESVDIPVFEPEKIATSILRRIVNQEINIDAKISRFDDRISNTYLIAAECARGLSNAKLYTSFNEFCDWMSVVFGYVYYLGPLMPAKYYHIQTCGGYETETSQIEQGTFYGDIDNDNIVYNTEKSCFIYKDTNSGKRYYFWQGSDDYNDRYLCPRTDTLFVIKQISPTTRFYFNEKQDGEPLLPIPCYIDNQFLGKNIQTVYFVHRSELFSNKANINRIEHCEEVTYSVDKSLIYSTVEIGYEAKDYDCINGRDEFNFNNTYSTGHTVSDKKLSMLSKYRADCYGLEFAVQKRGQDTTDSNSDNDVFFIHAIKKDGALIADRSVEIENTISNLLFNGAFSPMACVLANAGYIGMQADRLHLTFASSTGNSDIIIGGRKMSSDISIDTPLMTCGTLSFTTGEVDSHIDVDDIVEIGNGGVVYRGYVDEAVFGYANNEAVKYKLLVKDIIQ